MKNSINILFFLVATISTAQTPELLVQTGHPSQVYAMAMSKDDRYIITGSGDETIKLWDVATGRELRSFKGHTKTIEYVAFIPNSDLIASGARDKTVRIWNIRNGQEVRIIGHDDWINGLGVTSDGRHLMTTGGNQVIVSDTHTGEVIKTYKHDKVVSSMAISPNEKKLATISRGTIRIFNLLTDALETELEFERFVDIADLQWLPDGNHLAFPNGKNKMIVWNINSKKTIAEFTHPDNCGSLSISPDGKTMITGGEDGVIRAFDLDNFKKIQELHIETGSSVDTKVKFDNKGSLLMVSKFSDVLILDPVTFNLLTTVKGHAASVQKAIVHSDNKKIFSWSNEGIYMWDIHLGRQQFSLPYQVSRLGSFSPDHQKLYFETTEGKIVWIDTGNGEKIGEFDKPKPGFANRLSRDGRTMAFGTMNDGVILADANTGIVKANLPLKTKSHATIHQVAFNPQGTLVAASCFDSTIYVWDVNSRKLMKKLVGQGSFITQLLFTSDGNHLVSGGFNGSLVLWDIKKEKIKFRYNENNYGISGMVFNADESNVICASAEIITWNITTGQVMSSWKAHEGGSYSVDLFKNDSFLVTVGADAAMKIWATNNTSLPVISLVTVGNGDYAAITPEGYYMATRHATKGISFALNGQVYPFRQFDVKYNRPDLALKRMGFSSPDLIQSYEKAYRKRLQKLNINESDLNTEIHLPEISITKAPAISTTDQSIVFEIHATDSRYKLDHINVLVNQIPVFGSEGISVREQNVRDLTKSIALDLVYGRNNVEVSVINEKGGESLVASFVINNQGDQPSPELYVVAIGVSDYDNDDYDLSYAAKDATDICTLLSKKSKYYKKVNVLSITDKNATRKNIQSAKTFLANSKPNDVVIVSAAGHGLLDLNLDYYFATSDIDFNNPSVKGLSYDELEGLLDGIPARNKLLLMDACHSGEVDKEETESTVVASTKEGAVKSRGMKNAKQKEGYVSFELMKELFADLRKSSGAVVISSASGTELAFESSQWKNGVFTYALLEGLSSGNADLNKDEAITVTELKDYIIKKVGILTNGKQTPTSRKENLEFDFKVWE